MLEPLRQVGALLLERLTQHIQGNDGDHSRVAVIVCDLERFRSVNDSLGRTAGDLLPLGPVLSGDPRCRLRRGDFFALAAEGVDICERMFDGDPADPQAQASHERVAAAAGFARLDDFFAGGAAGRRLHVLFVKQRDELVAIARRAVAPARGRGLPPRQRFLALRHVHLMVVHGMQRRGRRRRHPGAVRALLEVRELTPEVQ